MTKYTGLKIYLSESIDEQVVLSFSEIEHVIGTALPNSAYVHSAWWANGGHSQANTWLGAGYKVSLVDLNKKEVVFSK